MRKLMYEYEDEWVRLGYQAKMASGKLMRPPPIEYRRVYHFNTADHAIANIALGRLKATRVSEMNDPYELLAFHSKGGMREAMAATRRIVDADYRFLCFSADWRSPAMWAHYADRHRGICLGFDLIRKNEKFVKYKAERVALEIAQANIDPDSRLRFVLDLITTKCDDWRYEEEIRAMLALANTTEEGTLRFFNFNSGLRLAEVILGLECNYSVERIREFVNEKHPDAFVFRTRTADKWFHIVPDENTCPWLPPVT